MDRISIKLEFCLPNEEIRFKLEPVAKAVDWRGGIEFAGEQIEDVDNQRNAIT